MLKTISGAILGMLVAVTAVTLINRIIQDGWRTSTATNSPATELPLYHNQMPLSIIVKGRHGAKSDLVRIHTIVDGYENEVFVKKDGVTAEDLLTFRQRTDGKKHASVELFGQYRYVNDFFSSAVVLVPDEESLKLWQEWMAKELKRQRGDHAYPGRVLPPK